MYTIDDIRVGTKVLICQGDPEEFAERTGVESRASELAMLPYLTIKTVYGGDYFTVEEDDGFFGYELLWIDSIYQDVVDSFEVASYEDLVRLLS